MDGLTYEHDGALTWPVVDRLRGSHGPGLRILRGGIQMTMRMMLRTYNRLDIEGRENLPLRESFVMVCNHSSHLDAVCLLASLPLRQVHHAFPVAAADYFFSTPLRAVMSTVVVNGLPLDRDHGAGALDGFRTLLAAPRTVLIFFPEGTRSRTGELGRFRSGVARLVAGTTTPVVPCHLSGAFEAWPKGHSIPRPVPLRLRIGRPRVFPTVSPTDRDGVRCISSQLRDDVAALGRQDDQ